MALHDFLPPSLRRVARRPLHRASRKSLHSSDFLAGNFLRREIRHVARQGYRDFEGIPTRPTDRPRQLIHPFSRRPETSSRLTSLRRTFSSMAPLVPNNRSDWSQAASACLDPPKRGMPNSCCGAEGRKECPLPSSLFLPSFLPSHLSSCPSSLLFSVSVFGGTGKQASERATKEGKGRSVGRHRRPLFSSEVGQRK